MGLLERNFSYLKFGDVPFIISLLSHIKNSGWGFVFVQKWQRLSRWITYIIKCFYIILYLDICKFLIRCIQYIIDIYKANNLGLHSVPVRGKVSFPIKFQIVMKQNVGKNGAI